MTTRPRSLDRVQQRLQPDDPLPQEPLRALDRAARLPQALTFGRGRALRTTAQIRDEYQFPSIDAVRMWLVRHQVPVLRRGRVLLADLRDCDAVMRRLAQTPRRRLSTKVS